LPSRPPSLAPLLPETEQQMLQDLMSEAMEEADGQHAQGPQENGERTAHHRLGDRFGSLVPCTKMVLLSDKHLLLLFACLFLVMQQVYMRCSFKTMTPLARTSSCFRTRVGIPPKSRAPLTPCSTPPSSPPPPAWPKRPTTSVSWTLRAPEDM